MKRHSRDMDGNQNPPTDSNLKNNVGQNFNMQENNNGNSWNTGKNNNIMDRNTGTNN